ncbi:MAG: dihydroorotase, partial [Coxiellaceae bacterium]|nr:dihydroorotase [Coxiellaceae bacterium]
NDCLSTTVLDCAARFGRALVMPNLVPPVINRDLALAYRERILAVLPENTRFEPLMALYLTDHTSPSMIKEAMATGVIPACKLYPAGATTHSDAGVTNIEAIYPTLECMQEVGMLLLIHGEVTDTNVDIFDREKVFIYTTLTKLHARFYALKMVLEHITTQDAVAFIENSPANVAATITAHHLMINRNAIFQGGIQPHHYCLPIAKRQQHQDALIKAATSGSSQFFLGTDSAPHAISKKETTCGCAGIYTSHAAIEIYAQVFEQQKALDKLELFSSINGAHFYGLPVNKETITLQKNAWIVPESMMLGKEPCRPFLANETITWQIAS